MNGIYYLEKAADFGKLDPQNWIRLSRAYQYAADTVRSDFGIEAVNTAEISIELAPSSPSAHRALGAALLKQGQLKRALEHLETAISIDSGYGEGWLWLGLAYESQGNLERAISAYDYAAQTPTTKIDALNKLRSARAKIK